MNQKICNNVNEFQNHYAEQKKLAIKKHILMIPFI